jgi:capsular polysaccharide biosynthesis protein
VHRDVLYGGILHNNFGHFLLESLGRLWAYDQVRHHDPVVFFYAPGGFPKYLERGNYVHQTLTGFGIPVDRLATSTEPVVLDRVIVPLQRYGYGDRHWQDPPAEWLAFVRTFRFKRRVPRGLRGARRIYVSRSQMPGEAGRPMAERHFEDYLRGNGYHVFHPQHHTLAEQLSVYSSAERLVFCDGGALHACVLLPDLSADVAVVSRRRDLRWDCSEIVDQFTGYGQQVLWIDRTRSQYQFGLETWNARTLVDWYDVSLDLLAAGFVQRPFEAFRDVDRRALVRAEVADYAAAVGHQPAFLDFLAQHHEAV